MHCGIARVTLCVQNLGIKGDTSKNLCEKKSMKG